MDPDAVIIVDVVYASPGSVGWDGDGDGVYGVPNPLTMGSYIADVVKRGRRNWNSCFPPCMTTLG